MSGIEFRTEYGQKSVHMIGLFPDNYNDIDLDGKFLTENILNPLGLSESMIIQKEKRLMVLKINLMSIILRKVFS